MSRRPGQQFRKSFWAILRAGMIFCLFGSWNGLASAQGVKAPPPPLQSTPSGWPVNSQSGWFSIIWGDGPAGASQTVYTLTDDQGKTTFLQIDEALAHSLGGLLAFDRKYVNVEGASEARRSGSAVAPVLKVTAISLAPAPGITTPGGNNFSAVTGSRPWVSIMCKFSDYAVEPRNLAFFQGMYAATKPGLDHYWRELSYDTANVAGSAASGWFVLPQPESYYNPTDTLGGTDLDLLATDCIGVADPSVDFSLFSGINMMFNSNFDNGYAWGGGQYLTLDGVTKVWSTTWEPPWGYADISVISHEMGHGFGLPHSSGNYGQTYDNAWDVMSQDRYNCAAATDPTYGCMAQHTIAYHLDLLGWLPAEQKFTAGLNTNTTITLEQLALPQTANYKMAQIPIGGSSSHFYTIEARRLAGYDIKLAGNAIVIHEVDTSRGIPAHVIDIDGNGITSDAGAMWTVGETFSDTANGITVYVAAATASGFQVTITTPGAYRTISGHIRTSWGAGLGGVEMTGLPNHPATDASGYYSDQVIDGWSGTVTPQKSVLTFDPVNRVYTDVTSDQADQDYVDTYEKILYVKPAASGSGNCSNWTNACGLQEAFTAATGGEEMWVAAGTYLPTTGTDRNARFQLESGVAIFGGFDGSETAREQRDPAAHVTILSGDIGEVGNASDNSSHVVVGASGAVLDGFTITAGNADEGNGGGMYNYNSSPILSNDIFSNNLAGFGGGLFNYNDSHPTLTNVSFTDNSASQCGGAIYNWIDSNPLLMNTTLSNNDAPWGAGLFNNESDPILTNVTLSLNTATNSIGGIYNDASNPQIRNTILWGNTPASPQIYNDTSSPVVSDSVIQNGYAGGTNIIITNPMLGSPGNYGGYTPVIPIQAGSSAIDTGNDGICPTTDQRGMSRPQGPHCDIGAYEYADTIAPTVTAFTVTTPINSLTIPITAFTATDDAGVTGYLITESAAVPGAGAAGWTGTAPITYVVAAAGSHTLYPWAKDASGHVSAVFATPRTVVVDLTAPDTTLGAHPANPTNLTNASFTFSSPDGSAIFECSLDGVTFASCTSAKSYTGLANGSHTFRVRAKDPAGNVDSTPASFTWVIDTIPPDTQLGTHPANPTNLTNASFTFSSPDGTASFECSLDGIAFATCTSAKSYTSLPTGSHTFQVRAKDPAGNVDSTPASFTWVIDLVAPSVTSSVRAGPNPAHTASVNFTVTFSESVTGVNTSDFSLTVTGVTGASVTGVSGSGSLYTVTVSTGSGNGSLRLDVPMGATIMDAAGNSLAGLPYTAGQTYTIEAMRYVFLPLIVR